jgi:hypothetical protein
MKPGNVPTLPGLSLPNCGHAMTLVRTRFDQQNTFECQGCKVVYMTDDQYLCKRQAAPVAA